MSRYRRVTLHIDVGSQRFGSPYLGAYQGLGSTTACSDARHTTSDGKIGDKAKVIVDKAPASNDRAYL